MPKVFYETSWKLLEYWHPERRLIWENIEAKSHWIQVGIEPGPALPSELPCFSVWHTYYVLMIYCVFNNNTFKFFFKEHSNLTWIPDSYQPSFHKLLELGKRLWENMADLNLCILWHLSWSIRHPQQILANGGSVLNQNMYVLMSQNIHGWVPSWVELSLNKVIYRQTSLKTPS